MLNILTSYKWLFKFFNTITYIQVNKQFPFGYAVGKSFNNIFFGFLLFDTSSVQQIGNASHSLTNMFKVPLNIMCISIAPIFFTCFCFVLMFCFVF